MIVKINKRTKAKLIEDVAYWEQRAKMSGELAASNYKLYQEAQTELESIKRKNGDYKQKFMAMTRGMQGMAQALSEVFEVVART